MRIRLKKQKRFFQHPDLYVHQGAQMGVNMKKIVRNNNIRFTYTRELDSDNHFFLFLYNPENGKDYIFNRLSALIWEMMENSTTDEQVINQIISVLEVEDIELYTKEINKTLRILLKHHLAIEMA